MEKMDCAGGFAGNKGRRGKLFKDITVFSRRGGGNEMLTVSVTIPAGANGAEPHDETGCHPTMGGTGPFWATIGGAVGFIRRCFHKGNVLRNKYKKCHLWPGPFRAKSGEKFFSHVTWRHLCHEKAAHSATMVPTARVEDFFFEIRTRITGGKWISPTEKKKKKKSGGTLAVPGVCRPRGRAGRWTTEQIKGLCEIIFFYSTQPRSPPLKLAR